MPEVTLFYVQKKFPNISILLKIRDALPAIIAEALDIPENEEGRLVPTDIIVDVLVHGPHKINCLPIQIKIIANDLTERSANIDERREKIAKGIRDLKLLPEDLIGTKQASIWILPKGSYGFI